MIKNTEFSFNPDRLQFRAMSSVEGEETLSVSLQLWVSRLFLSVWFVVRCRHVKLLLASDSQWLLSSSSSSCLSALNSQCLTWTDRLDQREKEEEGMGWMSVTSNNPQSKACPEGGARSHNYFISTKQKSSDQKTLNQYHILILKDLKVAETEELRDFMS